MPLGAAKAAFLGAAGTVGGGAYEYIAGHTFTGSTYSYTFTSIPQTYNSLKIVWNIKTSSNTVVPAIRLNGNSTSNYYMVTSASYSGTFYGLENNTTMIYGGWPVPIANTEMMAEATFENYSNSTIVCPVQLQWGCCSGTDQPCTSTQGVLRDGTAAITSIEMFGSYGASYPVASGSTLAMFGYKDA